MARIQERKAAKDYPANGIAKGDTYFYVKIKTGPYSSRTIRSKVRPKRWELTSSDFYSQLWQIEDTRFDGIEDADGLRSIAEDVRALGEEQQEKFDNMPEGLQQGNTGEMLQERADSCSSWADEIEQAADELDSELTEFDDAIEAYKAYQSEYEDYEVALADYENLDEDELAAAEEPVEPDQPDLPDGLSADAALDDDGIQQARQELIDNRVQEAQDANPGIG